jgi:hypothetical protein
MFSFPYFGAIVLFNTLQGDQFSVRNTLYSKRYFKMGLDFGLMATRIVVVLAEKGVFTTTNYNSRLQAYHFLPFVSLGLFQYGLLHLGQITGPSSPYFRGNHV